MVKLLANHGVISLKIKSFDLSEKHGKNSKTHWVKLVITTLFEIVKELAIAVVYQCFKWSITLNEGKKSLHFILQLKGAICNAAYQSQFQISKNII